MSPSRFGWGWAYGRPFQLAHGHAPEALWLGLAKSSRHARSSRGAIKQVERLNEFTYLACTTYSHAEGDEHWHVVVPFRREVGVGSWGAVWEWCHELLGLDGDEATKGCARIYFTPQHAPNSLFDYQCNIGELLEPPTTLAWNAPQRTRSRTNPTRKRVVEMDDAWWDAGKPMSQFAHLEGAELWKALRDEFVRLRAEAVI